jgi:ferredoxin-thioredoxin reductase catalytic chain
MENPRISRVIQIWKDFAARQEEPDRLRINPDTERVMLLAEGVLNNLDNHGFKYCPCRMISKDKVEDARLICPCNFKAQKTWKEKGECWCSLFVRDNNTI